MNEWRHTIAGVHLRLGGEKHTGWLPPGAATPAPTPTHDVVVNLTIELNDADPSCILICEAQDGSFSWDTWHESIQDAKIAAVEFYSIEPSRWPDDASN